MCSTFIWILLVNSLYNKSIQKKSTIADPVNDVFQLVSDTKKDINIVAASENETFTIVEGYKKINNCDDKVEDIGFTGM